MLTSGFAIGAVAGCAEPEPGAGSEPTADAESPSVHEAVPLAKAEGWRSDADMQEMPFAVREVAADADTAQQAWRENVPEDLGEGDSDVGEPGIYGSLDDADFDDQGRVVAYPDEVLDG